MLSFSLPSSLRSRKQMSRGTPAEEEKYNWRGFSLPVWSFIPVSQSPNHLKSSVVSLCRNFQFQQGLLLQNPFFSELKLLFCGHLLEFFLLQFLFWLVGFWEFMFLEVGFQYLFRLVFLESKQGLILSFSTSSRVIFTQKDLIFSSFWWWVFLKISTYLSHLDHIRPVTSCFFVLFSFFFFVHSKKKKNSCFFV